MDSFTSVKLIWVYFVCVTVSFRSCYSSEFLHKYKMYLLQMKCKRGAKHQISHADRDSTPSERIWKSVPQPSTSRKETSTRTQTLPSELYAFSRGVYNGEELRELLKESGEEDEPSKSGPPLPPSTPDPVMLIPDPSPLSHSFLVLSSPTASPSPSELPLRWSRSSVTYQNIPFWENPGLTTIPCLPTTQLLFSVSSSQAPSFTR